MRGMILVGACLSLSLTGCVTTQHGVASSDTTKAYQAMVTDTVSQMTALHPPAKTCFQMEQSLNDSVGSLFIPALRAKGYSLLESSKKMSRSHVNSQQHDRTAHCLPLRIRVDSLRVPPVYHVVVRMGNEMISRAYGVRNDALHPMGSWAHKEHTHG